MFQWYKESAICFAYLSDVGKAVKNSVPFRESRWFSRGWTGQLGESALSYRPTYLSMFHFAVDHSTDLCTVCRA
jgi:hypothetical protein